MKVLRFGSSQNIGIVAEVIAKIACLKYFYYCIADGGSTEKTFVAHKGVRYPHSEYDNDPVGKIYFTLEYKPKTGDGRNAEASIVTVRGSMVTPKMIKKVQAELSGGK